MKVMHNSITAGKEAEINACGFLKARGLRLLAQNYRCTMGEIDLIMQDNDEIVFIEVRLRNSIEYGDAIESISRDKQKKILKAAHFYLQKNNQFDKVNYRFDVIGIHPNEKNNPIEWIKDAFEMDVY